MGVRRLRGAGISPVRGVLTEFGAVHYDTRDTFHGRLFEATPDPANPAISVVGERVATDTEVAGVSRPGSSSTSATVGLSS